MTDIKAVPNADDLWDSGQLGRDESHARVCTDEKVNEALDNALELQMISIRLHTTLIEQLKFIAAYNQIGYQPLIRDVLARWARNEVLHIARQMKEQMEADAVINQAKKKA